MAGSLLHSLLIHVVVELWLPSVEEEHLSACRVILEAFPALDALWYRSPAGLAAGTTSLCSRN